LRRELEERVAEEERKRKELEVRVARKELEAKAAAEEQRRKELEARIAAEEQRRKELEARLAAEEQRKKEEQARLEEERRREELEKRAAEEERKRKELEGRAAAEESRRKELEAKASTEERRRKELEAQVATEAQRRKELEARLAAEEQRRRSDESRVEGERTRRQSEQRAVDEEHRRKDLELWLAEEKKRRAQTEQPPVQVPVEALDREEERKQPGAEQEKITEMRRQIEELTRALDQEKRAREEISKGNLQNAVKQLRAALEAAWVNGAPVEKAAEMLHGLAVSLEIPSEAEQSVIREVKLEMYSRAVKEVIAKRKLLRSSSSTLEWLRKVYQVSVAEYLEYESKFLLDLVADQYKGTILLVSRSIGTKEDITPRLKSAGYVVVQASTPESALEKIERVNPNLILCDTEFPDSLSGVKFLHFIRANSKFSFIPFILIGERAEIDQLKSSELKPNEGVIRRPVNYDELTALMNEKLTYFREYVSALS
jgi:CheY-like chemotaxis protein